MTHNELIDRYYAASITKDARYCQRWATWVSQSGKAFISLLVGDPYTRYEQLDGLLEPHELFEMSRITWYAIREEHEDWMTLYRCKYGVKEATVEKRPEVEAVFRELFALDGGFVMRDSEVPKLGEE